MLSVIVPVWNEQATIEACLRHVLEVRLPVPLEVIVVDDGSTDGTRDRLKEIAASDPRVKVHLHERNQGKAGAVRTGIAVANGDHVVIQDADLEYDPRDFAPMLKHLRQGNADVVNGNRYPPEGGLDRGPHRIANRLFTVLFNLMHGTHLGDLLSCYKVMSIAIARSLRIRSKGFQLETEMMTAFVRRGLRIAEIPIAYHPRWYGEGKKLRWKDAFRILSAMVRYGFLTEP